MSVLAARPAVRALEERGLRTERVLAAAKLSAESLASCEHRLPHANVCALWEAAASACRDPDFGVHVAERLPLGAYDVLDYLLAASSTIGEGLARLSEHARLIYDHCNLRVVQEPRSARLVARLPVSAPQYDEFSLALVVVRTRQASGIPWIPDRVAFQHDRRDGAELARVLGCAVVFGAPQTEIGMRRAVLQMPLHGADPALARILARHATDLQRALPPHGSLVARAGAAIQQRMSRELPSLAVVARALEMPQRTLQRQLSAVGVTHSQLVEEVRRELALVRIGDAGMAITEIAYLLHYADPSAFYRAFKRWTGMSPRRYRERLYDAGGSSRAGR